jgi:DNA-binding transcriptional regulator YdaS (Cro superfamily)
MNELPGLTHAELLRRLQKEIDRAGSQAAAARMWGISPQLVAFIVNGERNIGPKLLKVLKLRRVTLVVHRYAPAVKGQRQRQTVRKLARGGPHTERRDPE